MHIRNLIVAICASTLVAGGVLLPTVASAQTNIQNVPCACALTIALVEPSVITSAGGYEVTVAEQNPAPSDCYFDLERYTSAYGSYQDLGFYDGTRMIDELQAYFGETVYYATPYDCNGNAGSSVFSPGIIPTPFDIYGPSNGDPPYIYLASGKGQTVDNSAYFGGSALETTSKGAEFLWSPTDCDLNQAVVIGTGPQGGIGTVTVGGPGLKATNKGTINFYSPTVKGMVLRFKFGTAAGQVVWIKIVETKAGKKGGVDMYFDAAIEDQYADGCP